MPAPSDRSIQDWADLAAAQDAELEMLRSEVEYLDNLVQGPTVPNPSHPATLDPATLTAVARLVEQLGLQYVATHQDAHSDAYESGGDWSLGYLAALGNAIDLLRALAGEPVG